MVLSGTNLYKNHNYREILSTTCIKCINHLTSSMQMYARKFYQWHISIVEPNSSSHYTTSRSPHQNCSPACNEQIPEASEGNIRGVNKGSMFHSCWMWVIPCNLLKTTRIELTATNQNSDSAQIVTLEECTTKTMCAAWTNAWLQIASATWPWSEANKTTRVTNNVERSQQKHKQQQHQQQQPKMPFWSILTFPFEPPRGKKHTSPSTFRTSGTSWLSKRVCDKSADPLECLGPSN